MSDPTGNKNTDSSFMDVMLALRRNTQRNIASSEVCVAIDKRDDGTWNCELIGQRQVIINATILKGITVTENSAVLVVFTSMDFRANLKRFKNNQQTIDLNYDTALLHSKNYGIIIGVL